VKIGHRQERVEFMGIATDLIIVVLAGLLGGLAARRLNQPLILGYILAGIVVGPYTGGITLSDVDQIENLAEIGVALLLFSLGLEFSLRSILPIKAVALGGTGIQIALTVGLGWGIGRFMGWETVPSLWFSVAVVSSSTAVILKTLASRGQLGTLSSRVMLGMSIVQDILVIPLMVLLANLNSTGFSTVGILLPVVKVVLFVAVMFYIGARYIPLVLKAVSNWESRELFLLTVTAIGLGIGYLTFLFDLSFAFGAFMAGLVLSESDYGRRALSDLVPVRDIFGLLFFVTIGMLLDPFFLASRVGTVLGLFAAAVLGKGLILAAVTRLFGYGRIIPLAVLFGMIPVSEIAFIVLQEAIDSGAIGQELYALSLNTVIVSMILGPIISGLTAPVYSFTLKLRKPSEIRSVNVPESGLRDHVILAGGGPFARSMAAILAGLGIPHVILEPLHDSFLKGKAAGLTLILGNPAQDVILETASPEHARLCVVTAQDSLDAMDIIGSLRRRNKEGTILALSLSGEHLPFMKKHAVLEIIRPDIEAGLEMARQVLLHLDYPATAVQNELNAMRRALYEPLYGTLREYEATTRLRDAACLMNMEWVFLHENTPLAGKTLAESGIRQTFGVSVVAVGRDGQVVTGPDGTFRMEAGDYLGIVGDPERNAKFLLSLKQGKGD
jgi:CPA2 family monovalent cation:H+ antiporter-2